jgi:hypothetical protein
MNDQAVLLSGLRLQVKGGIPSLRQAHLKLKEGRVNPFKEEACCAWLSSTLFSVSFVFSDPRLFQKCVIWLAHGCSID